MNSSVYIFGNLGNGYAQHPMDSNQSIFQEMFAHLKGKSMIATHRDTDLIEYCYLRRLNDNKHIGIGVSLNGIYLDNPADLFPMFENVFSSMVVNGEIVHFENNGTITSNVTQLYKKQEEIDRVVLLVQEELNKRDAFCEKLPVLNFGVANTDFKEFSSIDSAESINQAIIGYPWVFIYKETKIDTATITSCRGVFLRMNKSIEEKDRELLRLNVELAKMKRRQRNTLLFFFFLFLLILLGIVIWIKVLFP